jgi:hypothetical protein
MTANPHDWTTTSSYTYRYWLYNAEGHPPMRFFQSEADRDAAYATLMIHIPVETLHELNPATICGGVVTLRGRHSFHRLRLSRLRAPRRKEP